MGGARGGGDRFCVEEAGGDEFFWRKAGKVSERGDVDVKWESGKRVGM